MTAAPVRTGPPVPDLWRLRVRTSNRDYSPTSPIAPRAEVEALLRRVEMQVVDCGDGWRFFDFDMGGGAVAWIRGREVTALEVLPPGRPRQPGSRPQVAAAMKSAEVDTSARPPSPALLAALGQRTRAGARR